MSNEWRTACQNGEVIPEIEISFDGYIKDTRTGRIYKPKSKIVVNKDGRMKRQYATDNLIFQTYHPYFSIKTAHMFFHKDGNKDNYSVDNIIIKNGSNEIVVDNNDAKYSWLIIRNKVFEDVAKIKIDTHNAEAISKHLWQMDRKRYARSKTGGSLHYYICNLIGVTYYGFNDQDTLNNTEENLISTDVFVDKNGETHVPLRYKGVIYKQYSCTSTGKIIANLKNTELIKWKDEKIGDKYDYVTLEINHKRCKIYVCRLIAESFFLFDYSGKEKYIYKFKNGNCDDCSIDNIIVEYTKKTIENGRINVLDDYVMIKTNVGDILIDIEVYNEIYKDNTWAVNTAGYLKNGKGELLHLLIFKYYYGELFLIGRNIDHINRNKLDCRIRNLRSLSIAANMKNTIGKYITKSSKFKYRVRYKDNHKDINKTFSIKDYKNEEECIEKIQDYIDKEIVQYKENAIKDEMKKIRDVELERGIIEKRNNGEYDEIYTIILKHVNIEELLDYASKIA